MPAGGIVRETNTMLVWVVEEITGGVHKQKVASPLPWLLEPITCDKANKLRRLQLFFLCLTCQVRNISWFGQRPHRSTLIWRTWWFWCHSLEKLARGGRAHCGSWISLSAYTPSIASNSDRCKPAWLGFCAQQWFLFCNKHMTRTWHGHFLFSGLSIRSLCIPEILGLRKRRTCQNFLNPAFDNLLDSPPWKVSLFLGHGFSCEWSRQLTFIFDMK